MLACDSIFGRGYRWRKEGGGGKSSSGSLSVFPEKERRPRGEEDEKGSIAEQRGKSRWKTRGKRGYVALALVTKGERERERERGGRQKSRQQPVERSKGVEQNPIKSVEVQLPSSRYMENIFWVKLVRPFKLSSRIARDLIVSQYPVKKGEKKKKLITEKKKICWTVKFVQRACYCVRKKILNLRWKSKGKRKGGGREKKERKKEKKYVSHCFVREPSKIFNCY